MSDESEYIEKGKLEFLTEQLRNNEREIHINSLFMCQHRSQLMCELYKDIFAAIRRGLYNIKTYDVDYDCILHNYTN